MPRIENMNVDFAPRKFKKRRAWLNPNEDSTTEEVSHTKTIKMAELPIHHSDKLKIEDRTTSDKEVKSSGVELEQIESNDLVKAQSTPLFMPVNQDKLSITNYESDDPVCMLLSLSGTQKAVFWRIASECLKRDLPSTGPIQIKGFFKDVGASTGVVRTTLNRLVDKGLIERKKGKLGRNGFAIISLPMIFFSNSKKLSANFEPEL